MNIKCFSLYYQVNKKYEEQIHPQIHLLLQGHQQVLHQQIQIQSHLLLQQITKIFPQQTLVLLHHNVDAHMPPMKVTQSKGRIQELALATERNQISPKTSPSPQQSPSTTSKQALKKANKSKKDTPSGKGESKSSMIATLISKSVKPLQPIATTMESTSKIKLQSIPSEEKPKSLTSQ